MPDIYSLIQSAGPGEINDVFADIRALVDDDTKVNAATKSQLATYNKTQFITCKVNGKNVIISEDNELSAGKFWDALTGKSFDFDHSRLTASNIANHEVEDASTL